MREEILVRMGLDQKQLIAGLQNSDSTVTAWSKRTARNINAAFDGMRNGSLPAAWTRFRETFSGLSQESQNFLKGSSKAANESAASWRSWGGQTGKIIAKVGTAFVAAFGVRKIIESLREVSAELDKLYANLDVKRVKEERRQAQLAGLSKQDVETIVAGDVATSNLTGGFKNFMAKGAGLYAFAGATFAELFGKAWKEKDPFSMILDIDNAMVRASEKQAQVIADAQTAARKTSAEKAAKEELKTAKAAADELKEYRRNLDTAWRQTLQDHEAKRKRQLEEHREAEKKVTEELKKQKDALKEINKVNADRLRAGEELREAVAARGKFTLGELADINIGRNTTREQANNIMAARRAMAIEADARLADRLGNTAYAERQRSRADEIRQSITSLKDEDRFPFQKMVEAVEEQESSLRELLKKASEDGLRVVPAD